MDRRLGWILIVGMLLALPTAFGREKGGKEKGGERDGGKGDEKVPVMSLEAIEKKVGPPALTADQKARIEAVREEILKKNAELGEKPEVKAAKEELARAREGGDREAIKAAAAKVKETMGGFNPTHEFKAELEKILTPDQIASLFPPHEGKGDEKGGREGKGRKGGEGP